MALRVAMAQLNPLVGDVDGNAATILDAWRRAADAGADLVVCTELALTGYPPDDLLLKPEFVDANLRAVGRLAEEGPQGTVAVVGFVGESELPGPGRPRDVAASTGDLYNAAAVLADGRVAATYRKWRLPNYGVFDEARYFSPDEEPLVVRVAGVPVGVTICEDLWVVDDGPVAWSAGRGARVVLNLNASPYHRGKRTEREERARHHVRRDGIWLVYVNQVGGQDEVVFDGDSFAMGPDGQVLHRGAQFEEGLVLVDLPVEQGPGTGVDLAGHTGDRTDLPEAAPAPRLEPVPEVWQALVLGTRDYLRKNGFERVYVALSGGIDSALTAVVACDAVGADHVTGVAMPSPHSSEHSLEDAEQLAATLGMDFATIPIERGMRAFDDMLAERFAGTEPGVAEENIQARVRGVLMMALSNKHGGIVLTTGNKSELAVGYATLYGDMAGGFAVLKDVPKTLVYELARYRNTLGPAIPERTITKPPSAELRPGQLDTDSLPPYEVLDDIIAAYVEDDLGVAAIVARGHDEQLVRRVIRMIDGAEYKRRQAPPGIKITDRAFGRDRRVPITNAWRG